MLCPGVHDPAYFSMVWDLYCSGHRIFSCSLLFPKDKRFTLPPVVMSSLVPYVLKSTGFCYFLSLLFSKRDRETEYMWDFVPFLQLLLLPSSKASTTLKAFSHLPPSFLWVSSVAHGKKSLRIRDNFLVSVAPVFLYYHTMWYLAFSNCYEF